MLHCDFCANDFDPAESEPVCKSCPLSRGCKMVRCPRCGYETLPEPKLIQWLRQIGRPAKSGQTGYTSRSGRTSIHDGRIG